MITFYNGESRSLIAEVSGNIPDNLESCTITLTVHRKAKTPALLIKKGVEIAEGILFDFSAEETNSLSVGVLKYEIVMSDGERTSVIQQGDFVIKESYSL